MKIGDVIKQYREAHGQSQRSMALLLGCSYAYVGMLEKGINPKTGKPVSPSIDIFRRMAQLTGTDLDSLLKSLDNNQPVTIHKQALPTAREISVNGFTSPPPTILMRAEKELPPDQLKKLEELAGMFLEKYEKEQKP